MFRNALAARQPPTRDANAEIAIVSKSTQETTGTAQRHRGRKMKIEWGSTNSNYVCSLILVKDVRTLTTECRCGNEWEIDEFLKAYLMMMGQREEE